MMVGRTIASVGIDDVVERLRDDGVGFRSDVIAGVVGEQIIVDNPSGNLVELFDPLSDSAKLRPTE